MLDNKFGRFLDRLAGVSEPWQDKYQRARDDEAYVALRQALDGLYPSNESLAAEAAYYRREPGKLGLGAIALHENVDSRNT